uniref:TMC domain-containing protein n=1 Tax=Dendroctonus ponderosae TaxID=77166 RepID=A0AAR5Q1L9_DENPD
MGMLFPCLLAGILNGCALQIFREPMKVGNGPLIALYIFIFTTFILLWSIRLYPRNLRKLGKFQPIIEFFTAEFLMEDLIIDFWFPLEAFFLELLPAIAQNIDDWVSGGWSAEVITDFLKSEASGFYASYTLALFFFLATLHSSRVIDLRTLTQDGPRRFCREICFKTKTGIRRILRKFGFRKKRKVNINEQRNTHQTIDSFNSRQKLHKNRCQSQEYCPLHNLICKTDSDSEFDFFKGFAATSKSNS